MKSASCKAKGRRAAKEVKAAMLARFKMLKDDDINVTSSGTTGEDLTLSPRARAFIDLSPEVKNQESLNIWAALAQAESNAGEHTPVVFFRRNKSKMYAALAADDLLDLYVRINELEDELEKAR